MRVNPDKTQKLSGPFQDPLGSLNQISLKASQYNQILITFPITFVVTYNIPPQISHRVVVVRTLTNALRIK